MSDPSLELQGAIVTALKSNAAVAALVADRVYDRVPETALYPLIQIGNFTVNDDGADCIDGTEIFADLHIWSRTVGQVEAKRITAAVRSVLHDTTLSLSGFRMIDMRSDTTRVFADPDGETTHAVMTFRTLIDRI